MSVWVPEGLGTDSVLPKVLGCSPDVNKAQTLRLRGSDPAVGRDGAGVCRSTVKDGQASVLLGRREGLERVYCPSVPGALACPLRGTSLWWKQHVPSRSRLGSGSKMPDVKRQVYIYSSKRDGKSWRQTLCPSDY